jgi:hypothetical protein
MRKHPQATDATSRRSKRTPAVLFALTATALLAIASPAAAAPEDTTSAALFANDDCVGGPYQVPGSSSIADLGSFEPLSVWVAG